MADHLLYLLLVSCPVHFHFSDYILTTIYVPSFLYLFHLFPFCFFLVIGNIQRSLVLCATWNFVINFLFRVHFHILVVIFLIRSGWSSFQLLTTPVLFFFWFSRWANLSFISFFLDIQIFLLFQDVIYWGQSVLIFFLIVAY